MNTPPFTLSRDPFGQLVYTGADGVPHLNVLPVRAFPLSAADAGLSLLGPDGHELVWIEQLGELPPADRALLQAELQQREFFPEIQQIVSVSTFATPSTWAVSHAVLPPAAHFKTSRSRGLRS